MAGSSVQNVSSTSIDGWVVSCNIAWLSSTPLAIFLGFLFPFEALTSTAMSLIPRECTRVSHSINLALDLVLEIFEAFMPLGAIGCLSQYASSKKPRMSSLNQSVGSSYQLGFSRQITGGRSCCCRQLWQARLAATHPSLASLTNFMILEALLERRCSYKKYSALDAADPTGSVCDLQQVRTRMHELYASAATRQPSADNNLVSDWYPLLRTQFSLQAPLNLLHRRALCISGISKTAHAYFVA
jgi:hypothetical protein